MAAGISSGSPKKPSGRIVRRVLDQRVWRSMVRRMVPFTLRFSTTSNDVVIENPASSIMRPRA